MKRFSLFAAAVCACFAISAAVAQKATKDIVYTTDSAGEHRADLYQPVGAGTFPAIVYIHGGSWRSGNKGNMSRIATDLAAQGYVGFSIDYDLHPHSWPTSFDETEAAIAFLKANAAKYQVDPARIAVVGTSAGGQLAALAALRPKPGNEVVAAVELSGVFELHATAGVITRYLGVRCVDKPDVCTAASPIDQVHAGAPPFFVGHGTDDHEVAFAAAQAFASAAKQAGMSVTAYDAAGGPHMYWTKKQYYADNLAALEKFLSAHVAVSAAPQR